MKRFKWMQVAMVCAIGMMGFTACSDDDDKFNVPEAVQSAFNQQYGGVDRVEWDRERTNYLVAEFWKENKEHDAWYTYDGQWMMTEVDYGKDLTLLPQAVQDGFAASVYAQWRVDDIDAILRPSYSEVYKIEVEQAGQKDMDLYFDVEGVLFKEVVDGNDEYNEGLLPSQVPAQIETYINEHFSGAKVVDFEAEKNGYEVDLICNNLSTEVRFDAAYNWVYSSTDYSRNIPNLVSTVIANNFSGKRIDDCDWVETPTGNYYLVDLDNYEMDVKITEDGNYTEVRD